MNQKRCSQFWDFSNTALSVRIASLKSFGNVFILGTKYIALINPKTRH